MSTTPRAGSMDRFTGTNVHLVRIGVLVASIVANVVVWLIARAADVDLYATGMGADESVKIGIGEVIFGSLPWSIGALIVFMLIERFASNPRQLWSIVAVIALAISFIFIFTGADNTGTKVTFSIMHIVAAAIIIPGFAATLRR